MNGRIKELVFDQNKKISEIDWKLKTIFSPRFAVEAQLNERWNLHLGYEYSTNQGSGEVTDSDFNQSTGEKTKFSKHKSRLEAANYTDFNVRYTFIRKQPVTLTGILGYGLRRIKVVTQDGFVEDPVGTTPREVYGIGIAYDQIYQIPYMGMIFYHATNPKLTWSVSTVYSNWVNINTLDNHFKRNLDFYDKMKGGVYYAVTPSMHWQVNRKNAVSLSFQYIKLNEVRGESYSFDTSTGEKSPTRENGAGIRFDAYDVVISWTAFVL
jgi:outer membrane protease